MPDFPSFILIKESNVRSYCGQAWLAEIPVRSRIVEYEIQVRATRLLSEVSQSGDMELAS